MHCYRNYVKLPILLPSILDRSTASKKPMHICMGVDVLLLDFSNNLPREKPVI